MTTKTTMHGATPAGDPRCGSDVATVAMLAFFDDQITCPDCLAVPAPVESGPTITLPATRRVVPDGGYAITNYREFRGMDGAGFNAYLTLNGKRIATVDDAGCGGEMNVMFMDAPKGYWGADSPQKDAFKAYVNRFASLGTKWDDEYQLDWCFAGVLDVLIEEASTVATLKRRKGICALFGDEQRGEFRIFRIPAGATRERVLAIMVEKHPQALIWDGSAWTPVGEAK